MIICQYFFYLLIIKKLSKLKQQDEIKTAEQRNLYNYIQELLNSQQKQQLDLLDKNNEQFHRTISTLQQASKHSLDEIRTNMAAIRKELQNNMQQHSASLEKQVNNLTNVTANKLADISNQVDKRLNDGFEKTTQIFQNVIKRLTIIDEAQKEIIKLSGDVVSLQDIFNDKRSRGAFGEVQLAALIKNVVPPSHFKLQETLSNGKRVDCLLLLPEPTGAIAIDAKFPLDYYKNMLNIKNNDANFTNAKALFKQSIKKHIDDIAGKYIIPGETADGSVLFIPAEAVFAEIHANFYDIVEYAQQHKVWLASPTTMMAILTTSLAAIKDVATKQQINIIQKHLGLLSIDFTRFQKRMDNLARHIRQADEDVSQIHQSSKKISARFSQIEKVELEQLEDAVS